MADKWTSTTTASPAPDWAGLSLFKPAVRESAPGGLTLRGPAHLARTVVAKTNHAVAQRLATCRPASLVWLWMGLALLVGEIDWLSGPEWSFTIFYLLPVTGAAWFSGKAQGLAVAAVSALVWLVADIFASGPPFHPTPLLWNFSARIAIFVFVVFMLDRIRNLNTSLEERVIQRTRELKAEVARGLAMAREMGNISHREQRRMAHELHDGLGQELGAVAFQAKLLAASLAEKGSPLSAEAERMTALLNDLIGRARSLSHLLDPLGVESGGLRQALSQLADRSGEAFAIACTFDAPAVLPDLGGEVLLNLYRIAQEAIHNAVEHGRATQVAVRAECDDEFVTLSLVDDGCGFDAESTATASRGGMGLRIMKYRAAALNARLEVQSAPGQGCKVTCRVPLATELRLRELAANLPVVGRPSPAQP